MLFHRSVSLVALLAAALGTSALAGPGVVHGVNESPAGVLRTAPPPPVGISYTAVVAANGALKRGSGATSSQRFNAGQYEVVFAADVTGCAYVATVGEVGSTGSEPAAYITVVGRATNTAGIYVETRDVSGQYKSLPFHVDVGC